ncbi:MAG: hypothetical protein ACRD15_10495, partial [Vicinamibacterales bacterium]
MSRVVLACALAVLVPVAARGEPITVAGNSATGGFTSSGAMTTVGTTIDLGQLGLVAGSSGTFFYNSAQAWRNDQLSFDLSLKGESGFQ